MSAYRWLHGVEVLLCAHVFHARTMCRSMCHQIKFSVTYPAVQLSSDSSRHVRGKRGDLFHQTAHSLSCGAMDAPPSLHSTCSKALTIPDRWSSAALGSSILRAQSRIERSKHQSQALDGSCFTSHLFCHLRTVISMNKWKQWDIS